MIQRDNGLFAADACLDDLVLELVHHKNIRIRIPGDHRFAQAMIGIDDGLVEAVVQRIQRKSHPGAFGIHLLLDNHRDAGLIDRKSVFFFVQEYPFIETGCERMQDRCFDGFNRNPQGCFITASKRCAFKVLFRGG